MKLPRFGSRSATIVIALAISLSGCSLWNKVWFAQGEPEQTAEKSKAPAPSKGPAAPAPASQSAKAGQDKAKENKEKENKEKEKDKKPEKPLTESQKEWEADIVRSPFLVSGDYFRQREPGGTFDLSFDWLFGKAKEEEQKRKSLEARLAKLEADLAAGGAPAAPPCNRGPSGKGCLSQRTSPGEPGCDGRIRAGDPEPEGVRSDPLGDRRLGTGEGYPTDPGGASIG
jgi:hypothetical protein